MRGSGDVSQACLLPVGPNKHLPFVRQSSKRKQKLKSGKDITPGGVNALAAPNLMKKSKSTGEPIKKDTDAPLKRLFTKLSINKNRA
jgi:hypothetical protein